MGNSGSSHDKTNRELRLQLYQAILENDCNQAEGILKLTTPNFVYTSEPRSATAPGGPIFFTGDENRFMKTPLLIAISLQNIQMVRLLIQAGADCNIGLGPLGLPIHKAVLKSDAALLQALLEGNTDTNLSNRTDGVTALYLAVKNNDTKMVSLLLTSKANPNILTKTHKVPLIKAVKCAYVEIVKELLSKGANPNSHDKYGRLPINWAFNKASYKSIAECNKIVKLLLYSNCNVNKQNFCSLTPLHYASSRKDMWELEDFVRDMRDSASVQNFQWLLQNQNQIDQARNSRSVLDRRGSAIEQRDGGFVIPADLLDAAELEEDNSNATLRRSWIINSSEMLLEGNVEGVEMLLEAGCDPDLATEGGITPLWIAAYERNHLIVKLLITHGCNIDKFGEFSETDIWKHIPKSPFRIAMERGNYEIARTFLKAGCNIRQESWLYSGANIEMNKENVALLKEIRERTDNPPILKSLVRRAIRVALKKKDVIRKVNSLPVPRQLKEYLLFQDLF